MITAYTLADCLPEQLESGDCRPVHWLNVTSPTEEDYALLHERYGILPEYPQVPLDANERPRLEHSGDMLLILARAPVQADARRRVPFSTCPVAIILTPTVVVTVCPKEQVVSELLRRKVKGTGERLHVRLALTLLFRISTTFIDLLRQMDEHVEAIEHALHASMRNEELVRMLHIEKSLIYFLTALKGNHAVMEKLYSSAPLALTPGDRDLLDDVLIENKQATDMAEIFSQIIGSLSETFGTIVSNNLNKVMKFLTGMTIVFMVPSIIASLYGMNVELPLATHAYAFAGIFLLSILLSVAVAVLFWKKNWM